MKAIKKIIAVAVVLAIVCSFAFAFSLYGYSGHIHDCCDEQCVICSMINYADGLMRSISWAAAGCFIMIVMICLFVVSILKETASVSRGSTPVSLKIKING